MPTLNRLILIIAVLVIGIIIGTGAFKVSEKESKPKQTEEVLAIKEKKPYWFELHRKSNIEMLYRGIPGDPNNSELIKTFKVKTGVPGERPTPLPQLLGREYWKITKKEVTDNPETAPYFITLDVPVSGEWPYGPVPYLECDGQCDWVTVGYFGLHGTADNPQKLLDSDPGSSGCIRHSDEDIAYLYNILEPEKEEIRYYIEDI